jgi:hypothetical protein
MTTAETAMTATRMPSPQAWTVGISGVTSAMSEALPTHSCNVQGERLASRVHNPM